MTYEPVKHDMSNVNKCQFSVYKSNVFETVYIKFQSQSTIMADLKAMAESLVNLTVKEVNELAEIL